MKGVDFLQEASQNTTIIATLQNKDDNIHKTEDLISYGRLININTCRVPE